MWTEPVHNNVGDTGTERRDSSGTRRPSPVETLQTTGPPSAHLPTRSAAQARIFSDALLGLLLNSSQFVQCIYDSTWLCSATRDLESYLCQYVDDTVILEADDDILTNLQHHALAVASLPHHV